MIAKKPATRLVGALVMTSRFIASVVATCLLILACSTPGEQPDRVVDKKNQAAQYIQSGDKYFSDGQLADALKFFQQALELNVNVDNTEGIVQCYCSIGRVYMEASELLLAKRNFDRALEYATEANRNDLYALVYSCIGDLYLVQGKFEEAKAIFEKALPLIDGKTKTSALIWHGMGMALKALGKLDEALGYFQKASELNKSLKNYSNYADNQYMIAAIYSKKGDYENARTYLLVALDYDKRAENSLGLIKDFFALGQTALKLGKNEEAFMYFRKSYEIAVNMNRLADVKAILPKLVDLADLLGRTDEAAYYRSALAKIDAFIKSQAATSPALSATPAPSSPLASSSPPAPSSPPASSSLPAPSAKP